MKNHFKLLLMLVITSSAYAQTGDKATKFLTPNSIGNSRHNMTQTTTTPNLSVLMSDARNNYGEVCVYCHTPHGANTAAAAPLWNRALPTGTTYQTYDKLNTSSLTQSVFQPGAASLPCLSCHDGSQAIDAILNMPGSGQYSATPNPEAWVPTRTGQTKTTTGDHMTLVECMSCHDASGSIGTNFTVFLIGTDLRNDHPVGVNFPNTNGAGTDWKTPSGAVTKGVVTTKFFDEDSNGRMDKGDIRVYGVSTGDARVECASCHDPHGVPTGPGQNFNPTFLRKTNESSAVCLTCHTK